MHGNCFDGAEFLNVGIFSVAVNRDFRQRRFKFGKFVDGQVDVRRAEIFFEPFVASHAGYRDDEIIFAHHPRKRNLRGRDVFVGGEFFNQVELGLIRVKARDNTSHVVALEFRLRSVLAAQKTARHRRIRDETDIEFAAQRQNFGFNFALHD